MQDFNLAILEGNLVDAAQSKKIGDKVLVSFKLASNHFFTSAAGTSMTDTQFTDCESWTQGARVEEMTKGRKVRVTGRMKIENWKSGTEEKPEYHTRFKIVVNDVELGPPPKVKEVKS